MKIKKISLIISLAIFMVFSLSLVTPDSLAYWIGPITGDTDQVNATVTTGTWVQGFPWVLGTTYVTGDIVTNNGVTYQAKKDSPTKEPGVDRGWTSQWTAL